LETVNGTKQSNKGDQKDAEGGQGYVYTQERKEVVGLHCSGEEVAREG